MSTSEPSEVREWRAGGTWQDTPAGRVFVRRTEGRGPTVLFLHGYPSSSFDFRQVIGRLDGQATLALDFLGFGLSDKPRPHTYSLFEQADIVKHVVAANGGGPVVLLAHDMGTSVTTELMARDLEGKLSFPLRRVVLSNGGVIIERASLRPIQRVLRGPLGPLVARLTSRRAFRWQFGQLFSSAHPLEPHEGAAQWALLSHAGGHRIAHLLTDYIGERTEHADRWHGAVRDWHGPTAFLWGTADPVATTRVLDGLCELRPGAAVVRFEGIGHYPQLEDPVAFTTALRRVLLDA